MSGIWDVLSSQQVIDFVSVRICQGLSLQQICEAMTMHCLAKDSMAGVGCDNMTVVVCALYHGRSEEEWRESIKKRSGYEEPTGHGTDENGEH
jgi:protein phosphatase 2C family protein 2/3